MSLSNAEREARKQQENCRIAPVHAARRREGLKLGKQLTLKCDDAQVFLALLCVRILCL